jgi:hypothetical protein
VPAEKRWILLEITLNVRGPAIYRVHLIEWLAAQYRIEADRFMVCSGWPSLQQGFRTKEPGRNFTLTRLGVTQIGLAQGPRGFYER